jgi:tRNA(Ile2) C34 agmatinyltransferase TiaS
MGLFGPPKCPHCGGPLKETGYSSPYPAWKCPRCIRTNTEKRKMDDRIKELEKRLSQMEKEQE